MTKPTKSPTDDILSDFLTFILDSIRDLFAFETHGRTTYQPEDIAAATLLMCSFNTSAETIQTLDSLPSADRILARLGKEKSQQLRQKINHLLKKRVLQVKFPRQARITVAVDVTENPFYGKKDSPMAMGGKRKAGTNYFIKYLTFSLVVEGHRYPVGFYPLNQLELPRFTDLVVKEVQWLQKNGLCDRVILDRGFNKQDLYNRLAQLDLGFLMPLKKTSKLKKVFEAYKPLITKYQCKHGFDLPDYRPKGWKHDFRVVVYRAQVTTSSSTRQYQWVFFITNLAQRPKTLVNIYQRRWGIETAYRQLHQLQAFTCSRRFAVRVFLVGLGLVLFSAWVHLNWHLARSSPKMRSRRRGDPRTVALKRFKISITVPQFKILLVLAVLTRMMKNKEKSFYA